MSSAWNRQHRLVGPAGQVVSRYVDYRLTGFAPGIHAGLPSRHLTLLVSFDDPIEIVDAAGGLVGRHQALIAGLHSSASHVRHNGTQIGVQLGLDPLTAASAIGVPVGELAYGCFELGSVMSHADGLIDRLASSSPDERIRIVEQAFSPRLGNPGVRFESPPEIDRAWRMMLARDGAVKVSGIADEVGWSRRHLSDRFRAVFGWSPREAQRVLRFELAHRLFLDRHPGGWVGVAADAGYADQSHLVREWKRITGSPPARWAESEELPFLQDKDGLVMQNRVHV
jgi:AraC-like DNA-binding protein